MTTLPREDMQRLLDEYAMEHELNGYFRVYSAGGGVYGISFDSPDGEFSTRLVQGSLLNLTYWVEGKVSKVPVVDAAQAALERVQRGLTQSDDGETFIYDYRLPQDVEDSED